MGARESPSGDDPTRQELREAWDDAAADPPRSAAREAAVRTSEHEGVVSHRLTKRVPAAGDEPALRPSRAWVSAPRSEWRSPEPEPATRD